MHPFIVSIRQPLWDTSGKNRELHWVHRFACLTPETSTYLSPNMPTRQATLAFLELEQRVEASLPCDRQNSFLVPLQGNADPSSLMGWIYQVPDLSRYLKDEQEARAASDALGAALREGSKADFVTLTGSNPVLPPVVIEEFNWNAFSFAGPSLRAPVVLRSEESLQNISSFAAALEQRKLEAAVVSGPSLSARRI